MTILRRPRGFSLVEVTLALGIAAFCLVVVFGLMGVGLNTSAFSVEQTAATNVLSAVASDLRMAPDPAPKGAAAQTAVYKLAVPAAVALTATPAVIPLAPGYLDANGQPVASANAAAYQLTVWMKPGTGRDATIARVLLSWPASATVANAGGFVETAVALDRN